MSSITAAFIGVSIDYMMQNTILISISLIVKCYFKRQFKTNEWAEMIIVALSLIFVELSSVINAGNSISIHVSRRLAVLILVLKTINQATYSVKLSLEQYYTQQ